MTVYRANRVQRIGEGIYGEMEAAVIRLTGFEPAEAERVVNAVLGPLRLAPGAEWSEFFPVGGKSFYEDQVRVTTSVTGP